MGWSHRAWEMLPADGPAAARLARACGVDALVAQCLLHRGVRTPHAAAAFFSPRLGALDDPLRLPDMAQAAARLRHAIGRREPVALFGDSDVDGITATAILSEYLTAQGAHVRARIANRIDEGYGLSADALADLLREQPGLVVLIDCGTNQTAEVAALARQGIETIILDHHVLMPPSPQPVAFVNPHRSASPGPSLCSAGLAFKVVQALCEGRTEDLVRALDLAALGTLADYAPLVGDNRILVTEGLPRIIDSHRPGLRQLCKAVELATASPEHVLRRLTPRLNAAGRLGNAQPVFEALTASSEEEAASRVAVIAAAHAMTKSLHQRILMQACDQVSRTSFKDQFVVVVGGRGWHPGLMGPVAAQLVDRYARPAIVVALDGATGTGSGRSLSGFNLVEALQACDGMLLRYGGHPQACGLTIESDQLELFRESINRHAASTSAQPAGLRVRVDAAGSLEALTPGVGEQVERCAPFGAGNAKPLVMLSGLLIEQETARRGWVSDGNRRLKLWGTLDGCAAGERYDVVVSPMLRGGEMVLSLTDARMSAGVETAAGGPTAL